MNRGAPVYGITGTPGTGKKTVAAHLGKMLGLPLADLNDLGLTGNAILGRDSRGIIIDPSKLRRLAKRECGEGVRLFVGHLIPSVFRKGELDFLAVLRCHPVQLERRYEQRRYDRQKIFENVMAEILDICLHDAIRRFGTRVVGEFDTHRSSPAQVAQQIVQTINGTRPRRLGLVNWLQELSRTGALRAYYIQGR